ncbi:MAG: hypothetical protein ACP5O7_08220 [Phycisphaerae bacterium]
MTEFNTQTSTPAPQVCATAPALAGPFALPAPAPRSRRWRLVWWLLDAAFTLAALWLLLRSGTHVDQRASLPDIWLAAAMVFVGLSAMFWLLATTPAHAIKLPRWVSIVLILSVAALVRIAMMCWWSPTLSDDFFRYRRDGHMVLHGYDPFAYLPTGHPSWHDPSIKLGYAKIAPLPYDLMDRMSNNSFIPTPYGPTFQLAFGASAWMEDHFIAAGRYKLNTPRPARNTPAWYALSYRLAGNPRFLAYRGLYVFCDMLVIILLMWALAIRKRSVWWATIYALNPLPLVEIAGNGHLETVGLVFFIASLIAALKNRWLVAAFLAGITVMAKPYALFMVPVLVYWFCQSRNVNSLKIAMRELWPSGLAYGAGALLPTLPFLGGMIAYAKTLHILANNFEFNGFVFDCSRYLLFAGNAGPVRALIELLWLAGLAWLFIRAWRHRLDPLWLLVQVVMLYLLITPQVYPWYALWALVLVPLAPNRAAWLFSYSVLLSYQVWQVYRQSNVWHLAWWMFLLEWIPVAVIYAWDVRGGLTSAVPSNGYGTVTAVG